MRQAILTPLHCCGHCGWVILDEPELHFTADVLVPDLSGWRRSRMPAVPKVAYFTLAPDWVCEVLSPSTAPLDRTKKLAIYAREGVGHARLVDPLVHTLEVLTLEVLRLESSGWRVAATHTGVDPMRVEPFTEIDFPLGDLWSD